VGESLPSFPVSGAVQLSLAPNWHRLPTLFVQLHCLVGDFGLGQLRRLAVPICLYRHMHCDRRATCTNHSCIEAHNVSHEHRLMKLNILDGNSDHWLIRPAGTAALVAGSNVPGFVDVAQHDIIEDHSAGMRVPWRHQDLDGQIAFLAILRSHALLVKAGLGDYSRDLLVLFGLLSMAFAAVFIIRQMDYKRLLAYSSVEHMGILALGVGIGGVAGFGSMFHAVNHSVTKAMLFLVAGNTLAYFHTKSTVETRGLLRVLPTTGLLWIVGVLAITGSPPFGTFLSEFAILRGMIDGSRMIVALFYLLALAAVFIGMLATIIPMIYGRPAGDESPSTAPKQGSRSIAEPLWSIGPPLLLALAVLVLGLYVPTELSDLLHQAAKVPGVE